MMKTWSTIHLFLDSMCELNGRQGLAQEGWSEKSGVTSRHISDIENGLENVGTYTLFKSLNTLDTALYIAPTAAVNP